VPQYLIVGPGSIPVPITGPVLIGPGLGSNSVPLGWGVGTIAGTRSTDELAGWVCGVTGLVGAGGGGGVSGAGMTWMTVPGSMILIGRSIFAVITAAISTA